MKKVTPGTTCRSCGRFVWLADVDAAGDCCLCRRAPVAVETPEAPPVASRRTRKAEA